MTQRSSRTPPMITHTPFSVNLNWKTPTTRLFKTRLKDSRKKTPLARSEYQLLLPRKKKTRKLRMMEYPYLRMD